MSTASCCGAEADLANQRWPRLLWVAAGAVTILGALGTLLGHPEGGFPAGVALAMAGCLCGLNSARSGRVHCTFTGPLFLGAGAASLLNPVFPLFPWPLLWALLAAGTLLAFAPEARGRIYWETKRA